MQTVEATTRKETALVSDEVSMAAKTTCLSRTADWLTRTPVPGAPVKCGHILPLQIISLTKRDLSFRSAASASLYCSRQATVIDSELTVTLSSMACCSTCGFAAPGCCATADPKQSKSYQSQFY